MIADVWCPWCRDHQRAELTADRDAHRARADAAEAEVARQSESYQRVMVQASALALARDEAEAEVARLRAIVEGRTTAPTEPTCECGHPVDMHRGADRCGAHGCGCDRNAEEASWR